jgi:hypothetical protein
MLENVSDAVEGASLDGKLKSKPSTDKIEAEWTEAEHDRAARDRSMENALYRCLYVIVASHQFNFVIFMMIIFNTVVLAIDDYP